MAKFTKMEPLQQRQKPRGRLSPQQIACSYLAAMSLLLLTFLACSNLIGEHAQEPGPRYLRSVDMDRPRLARSLDHNVWNPWNHRDRITVSVVLIVVVATIVVSAIALSCAVQFVDSMQERAFIKALLEDDEMQFLRRMYLLEGIEFKIGPKGALDHMFTAKHVRKDFPVWARPCICGCWLKKLAQYQKQTDNFATFRTVLTAKKQPSLKRWEDFLFASILGRFRGIALSKAMLGRTRVDKIILGEDEDTRTIVHRQKMRLVHLLDHQTARLVQSAASKPTHGQELIKIDDTRGKNMFKKVPPINPFTRCAWFKGIIGNLWCLRMRFEHPYMEFLFTFNPFISRNQRFAALVGSMTAASVVVAILYDSIQWFRQLSPYGVQLLVAGAFGVVSQMIASRILLKLMRWSGSAYFQNSYNSLWKEIRIRQAAEERESTTKDGFLMMKKYYISTTSVPEPFPKAKNRRPVIVQKRFECDFGYTSKFSCPLDHCCISDDYLFEGRNHPNDSDIGTDDEVIHGWVNPPAACVRCCPGCLKRCKRHPNQRAPWLRKSIIYDGQPKGCCWIGRRPRRELGENIEDTESVDTIAAEEIVRNSLSLSRRERIRTMLRKCKCVIFARYRPLHGHYMGDDPREEKKGAEAYQDDQIRFSKEQVEIGSILPPKSYEPPIVHIPNVTGCITEQRVQSLTQWLGVIKKVLIIPENKGSHSIYIFLAKWDIHNPEVVQFQMGLNFGKVTLEGPSGETWHCNEKPQTHQIPKSIIQVDGTLVSSYASTTNVQPLGKHQQRNTVNGTANPSKTASEYFSKQRQDEKTEKSSARAALLHYHGIRPIRSLLRGGEGVVVWLLYAAFIFCCAVYLFGWWLEHDDETLADVLRGVALGQVLVIFVGFPIVSYLNIAWHIAFSIPFSRCSAFLPMIGPRWFAIGGLKGYTGRTLSGRLTYVSIPQAAGIASGLGYAQATLALTDMSILGGSLLSPANAINHQKYVRTLNTERDGSAKRLVTRYGDFTMRKAKNVLPTEWLYQRGLIKRYLQLRYRRSFLNSAIDRFVAFGIARRKEQREIKNFRFSEMARKHWIMLRKYVISGRARRDALNDDFFTVTETRRVVATEASYETKQLSPVTSNSKKKERPKSKSSKSKHSKK